MEQREVHAADAPGPDVIGPGSCLTADDDVLEITRVPSRKDAKGKVLGPHERLDRVTVLKTITRWASEYVLKPDQLGSIEPGKLADIVVLEGNPLEGYWNFLTARVVIKGGVIVVDKRQ